MKTWKPEDIRRLRERFNLSQRALGELVGVTTNYIYLLEAGKKKPSKSLMILLDYVEKDLSSKGIEKKTKKEVRKNDIKVKIRRQWNSPLIAETFLSSIKNLHWNYLSGGYKKIAPQPFVHGYVYCDEIEGEIGHSCSHGLPPHSIKVCIVKKDNSPEVWKKILDIVGEKPTNKTSKERKVKKGYGKGKRHL